MKVLPPDIASDLENISDLASLLQKDETISEVKIENQQAADQHLKSVTINGSLLVKSDLSRISVEHLQLQDCRLEQVIFEDCVITDLDLYQAQLKNISFINCDFERVECSGATMKHVDLTGARIISIKGLSGLRGAHISPEQLIQLAPYFAQEFGLLIKE